MEYRPSEPVTFVRLIPVSLEVTSTRAPAIGCPSGPVTRPRMMSVVAPTCAWVKEGSNAANITAKTIELNRFINIIDPKKHRDWSEYFFAGGWGV